MAIRLVNGCVNCQNLTSDNMCKVYEIKVENKHTCDSFNMRASLKGEVDCMSCSKLHSVKCPNALNAAAGMLCNEWTPGVKA